MKVWMIFMQDATTTWLEAAWDDNSTAENNSGWNTTIDRARKSAARCGCDMRIISAYIPGVFAAFETPSVTATQVESE